MAYFMYLGYNLFYQAEPSLVFTLPLVMLVVLALAALVVRLSAIVIWPARGAAVRTTRPAGVRSAWA